jgi:hypothetical protein
MRGVAWIGNAKHLRNSPQIFGVRSQHAPRPSYLHHNPPEVCPSWNHSVNMKAQDFTRSISSCILNSSVQYNSAILQPL